jgi:hypothetical protein
VIKNLKKTIEESWEDPSAIVTNLTECCKVTGLEYVPIFKHPVDVNDACIAHPQKGSHTDTMHKKVLDLMIKNKNDFDGLLKWQYYGLEEDGTIINYPRWIKRSGKH